MALRVSQGRVHRESQLDERSLSWSLRTEGEMRCEREEKKRVEVKREREMCEESERHL